MKNNRRMKVFFILLLALNLSSCKGQVEKDSATADTNKKNIGQLDTKPNKPKESWNVKKETDKNGNLIRYDSTYTWSYKNFAGDSLTVDADSVMRQMHQYFNQQMPGVMGDEDYAIPFGSNTPKQGDFFEDDFFQNFQTDSTTRDILRQMDSLRSRFFSDKYPGLIEPDETKKDSIH